MLDKINRDIGGDSYAVETDVGETDMGETGMEAADVADKDEAVADEASEDDGWVTVEAPKSEKKADKPKKNENEKASKGLMHVRH